MVKTKAKLSPPPIHEDIVSNSRATREFIRYLLDLQNNSEGTFQEIEDIIIILEEFDLRISENETDIAALDTRVTINETDIAALDGRVSTNETDIATLDVRVSQNEAEITTNTDNISTLNTAVNDNTNSIIALENAGYITDAPNDGLLYGRKNGAWVVIP